MKYDLMTIGIIGIATYFVINKISGNKFGNAIGEGTGEAITQGTSSLVSGLFKGLFNPITKYAEENQDSYLNHFTIGATPFLLWKFKNIGDNDKWFR